MRILFMGTSSFAVPSFQALVDDPDFFVTAVVTQEDRPRDRGLQIKPSPIKECALKANIPIHQPATIRSAEVEQTLRSIPADIIVVASYGKILPDWLLAMTTMGAINVHASLLPRHRGAAPIQRAILGGDTESGITIMQMDSGLDTGPILLQQSTNIHPQETAESLHDRLACMGASLLIQALHGMEKGKLTPTPQDGRFATKAAKISKEEAWVDWSKSAATIHNQVRAFNPWPSCISFFRELEMKIWVTRHNPSHPDTPVEPIPGVLWLDKNVRICVLCGDGKSLELVEISLPGRKRISGSDLLHGHRIQSGELLSGPSPAVPQSA